MKIKLSIILFICVTFLGCQKEVDVVNVDFNVKPTNARSVNGDVFVYKLGDTCKFSLSGSAQNIILYSGEAGHEYDNRSRTEASGPVSLSFTSTAQYGAQNNTLQVFAINNLPSRDSATVVNASWVDITSRANLATSATAVASGSIDLSDILSNGADSLFIAFKYSGTTGSTQRTWTITNYLVNKSLPNQTYNLASLTTDASYWTRYGNVWSPANGRWIASAAQLQLVGGAAGALTNMSWIISKAIYANRVASDVPLIIKSIAGGVPSDYSANYDAVGSYKAVFVAFNKSIDKQDEVVRSFNIQIVP